VASKSFSGWAAMGWTVVAVDSEETTQANNAAIKAIDGDPATIWHTRWNADLVLPHFITIDTGTSRWIGGFSYFPRQDGNLNGIAEKYRFETSTNGLDWTTNVAAGVFGNIRNNPVLQEVTFAPVKAQFFRFTALQEVNTNGWTSAAELSVLPAGFDAWRRDLCLQTNGPLSDPYNTGTPLLLDYFQGANPTVPGASLLTAGTLSTNWFEFNVRSEPSLPDVSASFQTSTNLVTWSPAVGIVTNGIASNPDGTQTLQLAVPQPPEAPALFLRLAVTQL